MKPDYTSIRRLNFKNMFNLCAAITDLNKRLKLLEGTPKLCLTVAEDLPGLAKAWNILNEHGMINKPFEKSTTIVPLIQKHCFDKQRVMVAMKDVWQREFSPSFSEEMKGAQRFRELLTKELGE